VKLDLPLGSGFKCSILASKPAQIFSGSLEAMLINNSIRERRESEATVKNLKCCQ